MKVGDIVVNKRTGNYALVIEYIHPIKYRESLVRVFPAYSNKWMPANCYKIINESQQHDKIYC